PGGPLRIGPFRPPGTEPHDGLALHIQSFVVVVSGIQVQPVSGEPHLIQSHRSLTADVSWKRDALAVPERACWSADLDGRGRAVAALDPQHTDSLKLRPVITTRFRPRLCQPSGDV